MGAVSSTAFYAPVEGELKELERRLLAVGRGGHPTFQAAVEHVFQTPSKLLRPTLVFLSARFGTRDDPETVLNLAQSLELVHTASLGAFVTNLVLAFKMTDDILDLVGDEAEFGKAVGRDLQEGMATLPMIYAAAESGGHDGELARRIVAPGKSRAEVIELLRVIRASNGPERARARALKFHDAAIQALEGLPPRGEREALRDVADFVIGRVR